MKPQKEQRIQCVLKGGVVVDGIVESWSDNESILRASDQSSVIILHTAEDVMLIKILPPPAAQIKTELVKRFEQTLEEPSGDDLRIKKLAELKVMMADAERKAITEKMKDHHIGNPSGANYEQPGFLKKPRSQ